MDDLIRRSDAIEVLYREKRNALAQDFDSIARGIQASINCISELPTIEPKRGAWIPCTKSGLALTELMRREGQKWYGYRCSSCNYIYKGNALTDYNFCPNCGAKMGEREGE